MRRPNGERRPAGNQAATQSLIEDTDILSRARRHDYAVVVLAERADGIVVSQVYQHLAAAERRVRRTHERGLVASMHLVKLTPVPWTAGVDLTLEDLVGGAL